MKFTKLFNPDYLLMRLFISISILLLTFFQVTGQEKFGSNVINAKKIQLENNILHQKSDFGVGFGLDYGGLVGIKYMYSPIKYMGLFAALGYHQVTVGFQVGVAGYILPKINKYILKPYGKVMYGSNRIIKIDGEPEFDQIYFGFAPGVGLEIRIGRYRKHGFNIDLNYPINSKNYKNDVDYIKHNTNIDYDEPFPVTFSFGYQFLLLR